MRKTILLITLVAGSLSAQNLSFQPLPQPTDGHRFWQASLLALAAANTMDVQSSWGKHELNGTLANQVGRFGAQGALIKLTLQGSLAGVEYLIARHHPSSKLYRTLAAINFSAAATIGAVAGHNYTVGR